MIAWIPYVTLLLISFHVNVNFERYLKLVKACHDVGDQHITSIVLARSNSTLVPADI